MVELEQQLSKQGCKINNNIMIKSCEYCNQVFTSGKALGGHIRVHLHTKKQQIHKPAAQAMTTCCLCGRHFPSEKSLCGHMRSHPDRQWRGIQPPKDRPETSSTTLDGILPKWGMTGMRGRCATTVASNDLDEVVEALSLIAQSLPKEHGSMSEAVANVPDATCNSSLMINNGSDHEMGKGKGLLG